MSQLRHTDPSESLPLAHQIGPNSHYTPVPAHPRHGFGNLGRTRLQIKSQNIRRVSFRNGLRQLSHGYSTTTRDDPQPQVTNRNTTHPSRPVTTCRPNPSARARARERRVTNKIVNAVHTHLDNLERIVRFRSAKASGTSNAFRWSPTPQSNRTLRTLSSRINTIH